MSSASLDTKCTTRSTLCAGHRSPPVHRTTAAASSSSSRSASSADVEGSNFLPLLLAPLASTVRVTLDPHAGHDVGGDVTTVLDDEGTPSANPVIRGMTSPARSTTTLAPTYKPFRAASSKLCSVALPTVAPPSSTGGSSVATGVSAPVRPTCTSTPASVVTAVSAGNLCATAHRGARASEPSLLRKPASSTLYTTPSMRYPSDRLPSAVASAACAAMRWSRFSLTRSTGAGDSPSDGRDSRNSDCDGQSTPTISP